MLKSKAVTIVTALLHMRLYADVMNKLRGYIAGVEMCTPTLHGERPYINLDNAASTPPLKSVLAAVEEFSPLYSSVHRGSGFKSHLSTELYEQARNIVGDFIGVDPTEYVTIFVKNTTEAINKLSYRLQLYHDDIVLISNLEHHSNDLPWRARATVRRIATLPNGEIDRKHFLKLLDRYGTRIKLVAISGASNVTGCVPDIHWFARQAHGIGARIFVDCAQLAAHRKMNMGSPGDLTHIDYIAFSAHKMYAPFGCGALIARRDTFAVGDPEYVGGGTILSVTTRAVDWAMAPESDEAGSPNVIGAVAFARSLRTLQAIGMDTITNYERSLTIYALRLLKDIPGLTIYGDRKGLSRTGVVSFTIHGIPSHLVAARLGFEWGIAVRSGCFCAQPYVMSLLAENPGEVRKNILRNHWGGVPGMVRVSIGMYNTTAEIDALASALLSITLDQNVEYVVDEQAGRYTPKGYELDVRHHFVI